MLEEAWRRDSDLCIRSTVAASGCQQAFGRHCTSHTHTHKYTLLYMWKNVIMVAVCQQSEAMKEYVTQVQEMS